MFCAGYVLLWIYLIGIYMFCEDVYVLHFLLDTFQTADFLVCFLGFNNTSKQGTLKCELSLVKKGKQNIKNVLLSRNIDSRRPYNCWIR